MLQAMKPNIKQCLPSVQVFNITASVPRREWAATLSLAALALERQPVIVTGFPVIQHWPALAAWSDLCAHAPHLGRVFSGASRVFYHDNRKKPFAIHQAWHAHIARAQHALRTRPAWRAHSMASA